MSFDAKFVNCHKKPHWVETKIIKILIKELSVSVENYPATQGTCRVAASSTTHRLSPRGLFFPEFSIWVLSSFSVAIWHVASGILKRGNRRPPSLAILAMLCPLLSGTLIVYAFLSWKRVFYSCFSLLRHFFKIITLIFQFWAVTIMSYF